MSYGKRVFEVITLDHEEVVYKNIEGHTFTYNPNVQEGVWAFFSDCRELTPAEDVAPDLLEALESVMQMMKNCDVVVDGVGITTFESLPVYQEVKSAIENAKGL